MMAGGASVPPLLPISSLSSSFLSNTSSPSSSPSSNVVNLSVFASFDIHKDDSCQQHRRTGVQLHDSPLPPTRLFDDHSQKYPFKNSYFNISTIFPLFHGKNQHLLHHQQHRRWTFSQILSRLLVALMLISVWTTLGMTLVLLCQLDNTPFLASFPTFRHHLYLESSQQLSATNLAKPRVVIYHRFTIKSSTSSSLESLPPLQRVANATSFWEIPPRSPHDERMMVVSNHDDAHYDVVSSSQKHQKYPPSNVNPECVPMASWQTQSFPSCNILHEIDLTNVPESSPQQLENPYSSNISSTTRINHNHDALYILGQGWFRITWKYDSFAASTDDSPNPLEPESVVLKTLRLDRDFSAEFYELHRRDAVAMERLTFSPYVMKIYGYCGQSALNELADFNVGGMTRLEELSRRLRSQPHTPHLYMTKLQLAYQVAMALYHVHELPNENTKRKLTKPKLQQQLHEEQVDDDQTFDSQQREYRPVMVHYDVNPRNVALVRGGRAKLNDFNTCEFLPWNTNTQTTCGFRGRFHEPWWRAPEEMPPVNKNGTTLATIGEHALPATLTPLLHEKVDIYALGNILFHILTTHSPRGKMKESRLLVVQEMVTQGQRPPLPPMFQLISKSSNDNGSTFPVNANYSYSQYYEHLDAATPQEVAIVAFLQAMDGCYPIDPAKRFTARQVAHIFRQAMRRIKRMVLTQNMTLFATR